MTQHILVPTQYKEKLRPNFSYPIGAEVISSMLSGVPQFNFISLSFTRYGASRRRDSQPPFPVIRVGHFRLRPNYGYTHPTDEWYFDVYAVPSDIRKRINELLLVFAKDDVQRWLKKDRPEVWHEGRKELVAEYTTDDTLRFQEL